MHSGMISNYFWRSFMLSSLSCHFYTTHLASFSAFYLSFLPPPFSFSHLPPLFLSSLISLSFCCYLICSQPLPSSNLWFQTGHLRLKSMYVPYQCHPMIMLPTPVPYSLTSFPVFKDTNTHKKNTNWMSHSFDVDLADFLFSLHLFWFSFPYL